MLSDKLQYEKQLLKNNIKELKNIAESLDISILKLNKNGIKNINKTKYELIKEIINKNQNIKFDLTGHIIK